MPLLRPLAQPAVKPATMASPRSAAARSAVKLHVLPPEHIHAIGRDFVGMLGSFR
jgi:hypothetical protein